MRSAHWNDAIPHIQKWVLDHFEAAGKSPWDVEHRVNLKDVGINPDNFFRELAPKIPETRKDHWDPDAWWRAVSGRIYYFFHRASDKADRSTGKPRPRCWAEWPGPIPTRPATTGLCSERSGFEPVRPVGVYRTTKFLEAIRKCQPFAGFIRKVKHVLTAYVSKAA